jgi:hypothetical protein
VAEREATIRLDVIPPKQGIVQAAMQGGSVGGGSVYGGDAVLQSMMRQYGEGEKKLAALRAENARRSLGATMGQMAQGAHGQLTGMARSGLHGAMAIGGLGAAVGMVDIARKSMQTQEGLGKLAVSVRAGTGRLIEMQEAQRAIVATSNKWLVSTQQLTAAQTKLFDESGDFDFSAKSLEKVAIVARGAREEVGLIAQLAGDMNEKFKVSSEDTGKALASIVSFGHRGGISLGEMSTTIARIGMGAKTAGIEGEEGLRRMLGMATLAENEVGTVRQALTAVSSIVSGTESGDLAKRAKGIGVDIKKGSSFEDALTSIIAGAGGDREKLGKVFGSGPEFAFGSALSKIYMDGGGKSGGREALSKALSAAAESAITFEDLMEEATNREKESASKFERARLELENALQSDGVAAALSTLATTVGATSKALVQATTDIGAMGKAIQGALPSWSVPGLSDSVAPAGAAYLANEALVTKSPLAAAGALGLAGYTFGREVYDTYKWADAVNTTSQATRPSALLTKGKSQSLGRRRFNGERMENVPTEEGGPFQYQLDEIVDYKDGQWITKYGSRTMTEAEAESLGGKAPLAKNATPAAALAMARDNQRAQIDAARAVQQSLLIMGQGMQGIRESKFRDQLGLGEYANAPAPLSNAAAAAYMREREENRASYVGSLDKAGASLGIPGLGGIAMAHLDPKQPPEQRTNVAAEIAQATASAFSGMRLNVNVLTLPPGMQVIKNPNDG